VAISAAAVTTYCPWKPAYLSFLFLAMLPIVTRLFLAGDTAYQLLAVLGLLFTAVLEHAGRGLHDANRRTLLMGLRNQELNTHLAQEKRKLEALTDQLQSAHDQLKQLSLTDDLTGLWNRRFFHATIPDLIQQILGQRSGCKDGEAGELLFIMIDLDHFKEVNDLHGHGAGDQVLIQLGQLLRRICANDALVIRWGGARSSSSWPDTRATTITATWSIEFAPR
jgi:predicted signal transduction protein with EAL and GGDEF domain